MIIKCSSCLLNAAHPFGLGLSEKGECLGCIRHSEKKKFFSRNKELPLRTNERCLVPVTGRPEDFFVFEYLISKNYQPMGVFVNSYFNNDIAWENVHSLMHDFNVQFRTFNYDLTVYKRLVRCALKANFNILAPHKWIQYRYCKELAQNLGIQYIVSGENQPSELVGKYILGREVEKNMFNLSQDEIGISFDECFHPGAAVSNDIIESLRPTNEAFHQDVQWIYLSDFIFWDQWSQDAEMAKKNSWGEVQTSTFDYFHRAGSSIFYNFHDLCRFRKCGSLKVSDQLSREIRFGRIAIDDSNILYARFCENLLNYETASAAVHSLFKWLDIGETGRNWFFEKFFSEYMLSEEKPDPVDWQGFFVDTPVGRSRLPREHFCIFAKGVDL